MNDPEVAGEELDVRTLRKPDKHPAIFGRYAGLAAGASFVLVNDHDPRHLHDEFEADHVGSYSWEYLATAPREWRIKITKLTHTALPRVLLDTTDLPAGLGSQDGTGVVWKLPVGERELDAEVIAVVPGGAIDAATGPDLDVVVHVLTGGGTLTTERGVVALRPGALVWLPRRSRRRFTAGPDGLRYLSVHRRRRTLVLGASAAESVSRP